MPRSMVDELQEMFLPDTRTPFLSREHCKQPVPISEEYSVTDSMYT